MAMFVAICNNYQGAPSHLHPAVEVGETVEFYADLTMPKQVPKKMRCSASWVGRVGDGHWEFQDPQILVR